MNIRCTVLAASFVLMPWFGDDAHAVDTIREGVLTVGTVTTYAPMAYKDPATGKLTGADIDLATAIAEEMGLKIEFVEASFAQLIPSLQTGRIDTAMAGMSDRPARRQFVNFIDYLRSGAQFYSLTEKAAAIGGLENMCGKSVAFNRGAQWNERIEAWSKANCTDKAKPAVVLVGAESTPDARTQMVSGRADAAVLGSETIGYLQNLEPGKFSKIGPIFSEYLVAVPFIKGDAKADALLEAIKKALTTLQQNGKYDEILRRYGIADNAYKPVTINQGQ